MEDFEIPTVSHVLDDGRLVELVFDPRANKTMLAVGRGNQVAIEATVDLEDARLVPLNADNKLIKYRALLLPERAEFDGTEEELVDRVDSYIARYVDMSPSFRGIATAYVLLTWVYDAFRELPYLRLRGEFGSGKTRALQVLGSITCRGFFASGSSTVAPIFHALDTFRGTLILDEADFRMTNAKADIVKILNNGNAQGFPVLRMIKRKDRDPELEAYHVFGPKIVAMRHSFDDLALESRFLTENMGLRSVSAGMPVSLPKEQAQEALSLRNRLLGYRFETLHRVRTDGVMPDSTLSPRLNQILIPLLSVASNEDLRGSIKASAHEIDQQLASEHASSVEACVVEVVDHLFAASGSSTISVSEVATTFMRRFDEDFKRSVTPRYIGSVLRRRLHISTHRSRGVFVIPVSERPKIEELCVRYGIRARRPTVHNVGITARPQNGLHSRRLGQLPLSPVKDAALDAVPTNLVNSVARVENKVSSTEHISPAEQTP